jgi:hypothetical protein
MADDQDSATTIRLNILGRLELLRTPGSVLELPKSAAAHHLLALFAIKEQYGQQELVDILWPGRYLDDNRQDEAEAIRGLLARALSDARAALGLSANDGALQSRQGSVHRVRASAPLKITSDLDEFRKLAGSDNAEDWRAAVALVRGPVAQYVPTSKRSKEWIDREQNRQKRETRELLARVDPTANSETLENQVHDVLDGRWTPVHDDIENAHIPEAPSEVGSSDAKVGSDTPTPTSAASDTLAKLRHSRRFTKRRAITGSIVALVIATIIVVLSQSSHGKAIPPLGAVVNAETGKVSLDVPPKKAHFPAQIGGGPIFHACNVATEKPCKWTLDAPPISAHVGSVIEFSLKLHDTSGTPVPYVKLHATWQGIKGLSASDVLHELEATVSVQWSDYGSESIDEPGRMEGHGHSEVPYVHIRLPYSGLYGLEYIPGSSKLLGSKGELIHYLPDGIMGYGIALQDVGSPVSCNYCASKYTRYVNFRVKVAAYSE